MRFKPRQSSFSLIFAMNTKTVIYAERSEGVGRADFVEKLRISDVVIFRKVPVIPKSQMRFAMRRNDLPHEPQKANLAEPLALKSWSRCTDKNFTDFAKNGVFQQYRPRVTLFYGAANVGLFKT